MNKRYYEHTLPIIRGSLSNTYVAIRAGTMFRFRFVPPMTAIEAGCLSAGCAKSVMFDGMTERPFRLLLCDRQ